jgi:hypothetical protein
LKKTSRTFIRANTSYITGNSIKPFVAKK